MGEPQTHQLLLVEDDKELAKMVSEYLSAQHFQVTVEGDGKAAIDRIRSQAYDIVLLDIGLPGCDGISVCKSVRPSFQGPILMLTARGDEIDEVLALEVGADDYIAKPVRPRALLARLKVHLRRSEINREQLETDVTRIEVLDLVINSLSRTVEIDSRPISLTTAEFDLLWLLAVHAGTVVGRDVLYSELHGLPYDGMDRSIDLRVSRLRKKLGDDPNDPQRIKSIRAVGYLLASDS